jgi:thymidine kinase
MSLSRSVEFTKDHPGSIVLIVGPMFAGKTTELLRRVKRELFAQRHCCVVKYEKDVRYSNASVSTHDNQQLAATLALSRLSDFTNWRDYDVVAIDEGQFFPDIATFAQTAADGGVKVIISALDGDFQRKPFGKIPDLMPMCDQLVKVTAVCMKCQCREAPFTKRIVASKVQELIGGADMYAAVCRRCYIDPEPPTPGRVKKYNATRDAIAGRSVEESIAAVEAELAEPSPSRPRPMTQSPTIKRNRSESDAIRQSLDA